MTGTPAFIPKMVTGCMVACLTAGTLLAGKPVNFEDHVKPVFRQHCVTCHNTDKSKAGVDLSTYRAVMKGGSSGVIVVPADPENSALYLVVTHAREPFMPRNASQLADKELGVIREWIAGGAIAREGAKAKTSSRPRGDLTLSRVPTHDQKGPPPLPKDLSLESLVFTERGNAILGMDANPWSPVVAIGGEHQVLLYNTDSLFPMGVLPFPEGVAYSLTFSRNGTLLVAGGGRPGASGKVVVWNLASGERQLEVGDEPEVILSADISADQSMIAFGGVDRRVKVWSVSGNEMLYNIKKHTDWVTAVRYSPDGVLLATGDRNGGLIIWETHSGQEFHVLGGHGGRITDLSWRRDSNFLASSSEDGALKIWNVNKGRQAKNWKPHGGGVLSVDYSSEGKLVTCGRDQWIRMWDGNGKKLKEFKTKGTLNLRTRYAFGDKQIVSGDWNGEVVVISDAGQQTGALSAHPKPLIDRILATRARVQHLAEAVPAQTAKRLEAITKELRVKQAWERKQARARDAQANRKEKEESKNSAVEAANSAKKRAESARVEFANQKDKTNQQQQQVDTLTGKTEEQDKEVKASESVLGDLDKAHVSLVASLEEARKALLAQESEIAASTETNSVILGQARASVEQARASLRSKAKQVAEAKARRDRQQADLAGVKTQLSGMHAELEAVRKTLADGQLLLTRLDKTSKEKASVVGPADRAAAAADKAEADAQQKVEQTRKEEQDKKKHWEATKKKKAQAEKEELDALAEEERARDELRLYKAAQFDEIIRVAGTDVSAGLQTNLAEIVGRAKEAVKPLPPVVETVETAEPELDLRFLAVADDRPSVPGRLAFFGRFHMVLLHLPIGMLIAVGFLEGLAFFRKNERLRVVSGPLLILGTLCAILAAASGWLHALEGGFEESAIYNHRWSGVGTAALASLAVFARWKVPASRVYGLVLVLLIAALILAGHYGGLLTHGPGYLLKYAGAWGKDVETAEISEDSSAMARQYYLGEIEPVLSANCFGCHGATKTKGGLQLHERELALQGGDSELPAIVPGNPLESEMVRRITLPPEDDDRMPPANKDQLSADEILLLVQWIHRGAPGL